MAELLRKAVTAHRILLAEGVMDAFGHVSVRDADDPNGFWLSAALPPSMVAPGDFILHGVNGEPLESTGRALFAERFIHAETYKARPDVNAVCHCHPAAILPFCIGAGRLFAVSQTGGFLGEGAPVWDSADEFGDTDMLVAKPEQGASMARALGSGSVVLLRGHGATFAGRSLEDVVFKSVYACRESWTLLAAANGGSPRPLTRGEIRAIGEPHPRALERCWAHWSALIEAQPGHAASEEPRS